MTTVLAVAAILAAAACPLHMLWQRRRGRAGRCVARPGESESLDVRQRRLAARVEELSQSGRGPA